MTPTGDENRFHDVSDIVQRWVAKRRKHLDSIHRFAAVAALMLACLGAIAAVLSRLYEPHFAGDNIGFDMWYWRLVDNFRGEIPIAAFLIGLGTCRRWPGAAAAVISLGDVAWFFYDLRTWMPVF